MKKVKKQQKAEAKTAMVSLSIVSLMLGALLLNETFSKSIRPVYIISDNHNIESLNRAIASAQPLNPFRDVEWERTLAKKLGTDTSLENRNPASVGRAVSSADQLRFGPLAGKYHLVDQANSTTTASRIKEIDYIDSLEATDRPVFIDAAHFLKEYGNVLAVNFEQFEPANSTGRVQDFRLLDNKRNVVGAATFTVDDEGRFLSLKVREAAASQ